VVKRLLAALAVLLAGPAYAQDPGDLAGDLPAAVVEPEITVSSDYRGSFITVFGHNPDRRGRGDIVVVVRGPNVETVVMRKRRQFGLYINGDPVRFAGAPSFFAVLSTRPIDEIASPQLIRQYHLDPAASAQLETSTGSADPSAYRAALVRLRHAQGLYRWYVGPPTPQRRSGLSTYPGGLFLGVVRLPANAPIAQYNADAYMFRDGRLISAQRIPVTVSRVGVERRIHDLATTQSFLYGVATVLVALFAGWIASLLFRRT
jgi:uncharacterized protein (TIGR02186 family)